MKKQESLRNKINGLCRDCAAQAPYKSYTRCLGCLAKLQETRSHNRQARLRTKRDRIASLAVAGDHVGDTGRKMFASVLPSDPRQAIIAIEGQPGYFPFGERCNDEASAQALADRYNCSQGISDVEARAARSASMFGWHRFSALREMYGRGNGQ